MAGIANSITQPFGLKLFGGRDYPDRGIGDQAMNASAPLQSAGQNLLQMGQNALPNLYAQWANATGIQNPFASSSAMNTPLDGMGPGPIDANRPGTARPNTRTPNGSPSGSPGGSSGGFDINSVASTYGLSPQQAANFNNQASMIEAQRKQALEGMQSSNAARGLSRSGAAAMEQHIHNMADTELQNLLNTHIQQAHAERLGALQALMSGANQNIAQGGGLIQGNVGVLQNQAQAATQRTNQGNAALGGALGLAFGGLNPVSRGTAPPFDTSIFTGPSGYAPGIQSQIDSLAPAGSAAALTGMGGFFGP